MKNVRVFQWTLITQLFIITFICLGASFNTSFGQKTMVFGRITETTSGGPVAFATVHFMNTTIGAYSDELGNYILESENSFYQISVKAVGFQDTIINIIPGTTQEISLSLCVANYLLDEIVVHAGENPAYSILRKVITAKSTLNPDFFDAYEYKSYNKIQFDLNNFSDKIKTNFLFRPFPFIWEYQDSMSNGVRYLPFLFKENVRQHYYRKKPRSYKEYIIGHQNAQFFKGPKIEEFIEDLNLNPNIYDNFLVILNKSFPSPINDNFERYYRYLLSDSIVSIKNQSCHHIRFYPRGSSDVAFIGDMYIQDSTFAIVQIDLNFSIEANINFVRSFWLRMNYDRTEENKWFTKHITVLADFTVVENSSELTGFFGKRYSEFQNIKINQTCHDSIFSPIESVIEEVGFDTRDNIFWEAERSLKLSQEETDIFTLVDTIRDNWKFKAIKNSFIAIGTGYIPTNSIEIGNIMTFISYNDVEHARLKFGFRLPQETKYILRPECYIAYGFKDQRWKYLAQLDWMIHKNKNKHFLVGISLKNDAVQLGLSYNALPLDHMLTPFIQFAPLNSRMFLFKKEAYIERQWFKGFITRMTYQQKKIQPFGNYTFNTLINQNETPLDHIYTSGVILSGRFAFGEEYVTSTYDNPGQRYFMSKYPVLSFEFIYNDKNIFASDFNRTSTSLRVEHDYRLNRWGYLTYILEAGKTWGKIPYPLLSIPFGNQSLLAERTTFNLMNFMEFASDEFFAGMVEYHMEGLLLNVFKFNKSLKLREFILAKVYLGNLSSENDQKYWSFPESLNGIKKPYVEVGFGIENIIKLGRVDFTWRLSYANNKNVYYFLPKPSFQFRF